MSWLTSLFKPVSDVVNKWQDGRQKKAERADRIEEARVVGQIALINKHAEGDGNADLEAMRQMQFSWKDEYLTIIFTMPFIASFIPSDRVQAAMVAGWAAVAETPEWYQWCLVGIVIATFGLRSWAARTRIK